MNAPHLLDPDLSLRVALTLVHFLWQGVAVAILAAVACAALRRATASARYRVLLGALLFLALCPLVTFALLRPAPQRAEQTTPPVPLAAVSAPVDAPVGESAPVLQAAPALAETAAGEPTAPAPSEVAPVLELRVIPAPTWINLDRLKPLAPWMTLAYAAGALGMTARLLLALRGGQRLRKRAGPVSDAPVLDALSRQARRLGLRRVPVVAWCRSLAAPAVVGVLRPMVLLPVALSSGMSLAQIESILAHELAHVRRLDPLVNVLQGLIEAFLFFHPAVWFVSRRLRLERENCCDDMVLSAGGAPLDYVRSLVRAAELGMLADAPPPGAALAAVGKPSHLRQRIVRLLQGEPSPQLRVSPGPLLALALVAAVGAGAWYHVARAADNPDDSAPAAPTFVGRLIDPEGRPVSNGYVGPAGSNLWQGARTDADGVFKLSDIKPDQKRWAAYSQRSRRMALFTIPPQAPAEPVDVTLLYREANADGRVLDAAGVPVKGAKVTLRLTTRDGQVFDLPAVQDADEQGRYATSFVPSGGGLTTQARVNDEATDPLDLGRQFTLELPDLVSKTLKGTPPAKPEPRVRYSGRVVDEQGKPVAGAEIQMYYPKNNMSASAGTLITDADGRFSRLLPADAERVTFRLSHPECVSYQFERGLGTPAPVEALRNGSAVLTMKRGLSIRGVVKGPDGKSLSNALVMGADSYSTTPGPENEPIEDFTSPRTAADGSFRIGGLPPGWLEVMVTAYGLAPRLERIEVKPDAPPAEIAMDAGKAYAARVTDPDGNPVAGATVSVDDWRSGGRPRRGISRQAKTDEQGRFTLPALPTQGQMEISVGKSGFLHGNHEWSAAGPEPASLTLYPHPVIRGRVVDADTGEPVKNFRAVTFWGKPPHLLNYNSPADGQPDGSFALKVDRVIIQNPDTAPFFAEIQAKNYVPQLTPAVFAGKKYEPFVIKLQKGDPTTGVVSDMDGKPAPGAIVALVKAGAGVVSIEGARFTPHAHEPHPQTKTDDAGRFDLPPGAAEGRLLVLHDKGYLILPHPGLPKDAKLTLVPWARVEGTARDPDGKPLHGVRVALRPGNVNALFGGNIQFNLRATTHVNGKFVFDKAPSAPWRVTVETNPDAKSVDITPEPGTTTPVELGGAGKPGVG